MWSYRALVFEFGEDIALELLQHMTGFGEYEPNISRYDMLIDTPCIDVHDEIPVKFEVIPLCYLKLEVGMMRSLWRTEDQILEAKNKSILST